jgi:hypothetical protein
VPSEEGKQIGRHFFGFDLPGNFIVIAAVNSRREFQTTPMDETLPASQYNKGVRLNRCCAKKDE